jgi:2-oxoisovalerate dehydrogenase E1 component
MSQITQDELQQGTNSGARRRRAEPFPEPTEAELQLAYRVACRSRSTEEHIVRLASRGEVKFAIWGPGEEVHGAATALALSKVVGPDRFGIVPHYRSGCLCAVWCALHGKTDFTETVLRQQFSKDTDSMSRGRQMVYHLDIKDMGILPVQSPVGMQLGKAAGYALGFQLKGVHDALTMGIVGDGTTAEGDMHDAMTAASVWSLPFILMVTDNGIAISTTPQEGRGIKDFESYAGGFGVKYFTCDGRDFWEVYATVLRCARYVRDEQKPAMLYVHSLPRFNGHSSAADMTFDLGQDDPLVAFGEKLVQMGVLAEGDNLIRAVGEGRDFFSHHELGRVMSREDESVRAVFEMVKAEANPPVESVSDHIYPPFPMVTEAAHQGKTEITYGGAIRAALDHIMRDQGGAMWGQDVAKLGGVMQASAGLLAKHPERIFNAPLNEPLILGTACGAGLHDDLVTLPEIQFGDYSLNAFHWLVHMGNTYWCSNGQSRYATILRMPTDPFGGGAVYHSMSLDGYFTPIPGLVILMPSTSWDAYGLLMTAADYRGPVVVLEPKWMYRQKLGPAFPGEPTDKDGVLALNKHIMRGGIPEIDPALRVPFSKAALRRAGEDLTIVAWGRAVWTAMEAAEQLAKEGVSAEVLDLRTLVPPDLEGVFASVERTGRLIVAAEDRSFAGFVRSIQGAVVERFPGMPTRALGQKNIPGIAQSLKLEEATVLTEADIVAAARELRAQAPTGAGPTRAIPPRYFL